MFALRPPSPILTLHRGGTACFPRTDVPASRALATVGTRTAAATWPAPNDGAGLQGVRFGRARTAGQGIRSRCGRTASGSDLRLPLVALSVRLRGRSTLESYLAAPAMKAATM